LVLLLVFDELYDILFVVGGYFVQGKEVFHGLLDESMEMLKLLLIQESNINFPNFSLFIIINIEIIQFILQF
jgi:hypothetical protein